MKGKARYFQAFALAALLQPLAVTAHPFHWASESIGFIGGLIHPLTGVDHLIIMLATGLWVSRIGRPWHIFMPLAFAVLMLFGCGMTLVLIEIVYAEPLMHLAVLTLVMTLIRVRKIPGYFAIPLFTSVAVLHGYVHAYDMWLDFDTVTYTLGFSLTTMVLILVGIAVGVALNRLAVKSFFGKLIER
ncbi:HupE/UreJ family protein [Methylomonas sp. MgM2]